MNSVAWAFPGYAGGDQGFALGYRLNNADTDVAGSSVDSVGTLQVGPLLFIPVTEKFQVRTGFLYAQRHYETKSGTTTTDVELAYVDVPVTLCWKMSDSGGPFIGAGVGLKVSDDCGGQDCTEAKSSIVPFTFGGFFKVAPQVGMEVFYEMIPGEIIQNLEDATAVGVNAVITFD